MKMFFEYIRKFRRTALFFLIFSAAAAVVTAAYGEGTEAVIYSFSICAVIGIAAVIMGYIRFRKNYSLLEKIYDNLPLMTECLPEADNITEKMLEGMIVKLNEINNGNITMMKASQQNNYEYFTVWVHQIKTPISAMQMILQSEDSELSRELSAELFRIEQYAGMALQYIRIDSDSSDFVIRCCELDAIVKKAVRHYAPLFIRRKIRLDYRPAEILVITDEKWLGFVIEQLLSNAVKYTEIGGCVTLKVEKNILSVSDTGIGIAPEDLPRIFEKGYTGLTGRRDTKSTGLGLYLCKRICDKLGHGLSAQSEIGVGSIFSLDLSQKNIEIE